MERVRITFCMFYVDFDVLHHIRWSYVGYKAVQAVPTKDLWSVIGNVLTIFQTAAFLEVCLNFEFAIVSFNYS